MSVKSDMMEIIDQAITQKTSAYDSTAEVTRVEGDTIWVHLAGGVTETPVRKTISARPGDTVQVRVSGGRAWIQGNETNPPTDDTAANKAAADAVRANAAAQSAVQSATTASVAAADAQEKATTASTAAATALTKAQEAEDSAEQAATAAATADSKATAAGTAAAAAQTSADNAASAAATADSKATAASSAASRAESSASAASTAASQAVTDAAAAQTAANNAGQAASRAQAAADAAQGEIDDQQEYFWHDALGAHVLSDTDEVTGIRYRTDLKGAGQEIFELDGQTEKSVAKFGADGAIVGVDSRMEMTQSGIEGINIDGMSVMDIGLSDSAITAEAHKRGIETNQDIGFNEQISFTAIDFSNVPSSVTSFSLKKDSNFVWNRIRFYNNSPDYITSASPTSISGMSLKSGSGGSPTATVTFALNTMTLTRGTNKTASAYAVMTLNSGNSIRIDIVRKYDANLDALQITITTQTASSGTFYAVDTHTDAVYQTSTDAPVYRFGTRDTSSDMGGFSFTGGEGLRARYNHQIAFGKYNSNLQSSLFEIGNGSDNNNRSNALTLSIGGGLTVAGGIWDGNNNRMPAVRAGLSGSVSVPANSYKDVTIAFDSSFNNTPTVVCSLYSTSTAGAIGSMAVSAINIETTKFTARVFNAGSASRSPAVSWIATSLIG